MAGVDGRLILSFGDDFTSSNGPGLEVFLSPDRRKVLVVATPSVPELDSVTGRLLMSDLEGAYRRVKEEYGDALAFEAVGGPLYAAQHDSMIRRDLIRTVLGSSFAITLLLMLYFRGPRIPLSLVTAVVAGVVDRRRVHDR